MITLLLNILMRKTCAYISELVILTFVLKLFQLDVLCGPFAGAFIVFCKTGLPCNGVVVAVFHEFKVTLRVF